MIFVYLWPKIMTVFNFEKLQKTGETFHYTSTSTYHCPADFFVENFNFSIFNIGITENNFKKAKCVHNYEHNLMDIKIV